MVKNIEEVERAESEIRDRQKDVDYQIREYPIEVLVNKHIEGQQDGTNELFVPDYQRDLVWEEKRQSLFIESLLIGLPIPYLFVADVGSESEEFSGRLEIIDGTQRIRTLARFLTNQFALQDLEKLSSLNGFFFSDLAPSRQRRFRRITLRLIELTEQADEETRVDMFDRINTGSLKLNPMETRRGKLKGPFIQLASDLGKDPAFRKLAPISEARAKRFEREELVCRFFAFLEGYERFGAPGRGKVVSEFVDEFVEGMNKKFVEEGKGGATEKAMRETWAKTMKFVEAHFATGFAKVAKASSTPRVRFEAIAVGAALALAQQPNLKPQPTSQWLEGKEFELATTSDAANNRERVLTRIRLVREKLLAAS